jgi:hypothetical protein
MINVRGKGRVMKGKAIIIHTDGRTTKEEFSSTIPLEKFQGWVGGSIELVPYFTKFEGEACVAFCNEEGKLEGLPVNITATFAWARSLRRPVNALGDVLNGPVVIVTGDAEFMEAL